MSMVAVEELSAMLWTERELLAQLQFKIDEERAILATGRTEWMAWCASEIKSVCRRIERADTVRVQVWAGLTDQLGLAPGATMRDAIAKVTFPWDEILSEHQRAMVGTARELARSCRDDDLLERSGVSDVTRRLSWLVPTLAA